MIKEGYLKKLNDHLLEFSKQVGLPIGDYRIDHGLNSVAEIKFRHDFANKYREKISEVMEMFTKVPGIFEICDYQSEDVLRGGEVRSVGIEVKRRYWYEGHIEEEWDEEQERLDNDPEYAKKKQEEELEEKRKYWRDYLIPIPKPPKDATDEAYLTLAYEYYDMIKSGEKTTEFREYSPFWVKRLLSHPIKTVRFQRGYGGPGHPPPEQMVFKVKDIVLYEIGTRKECPADNPCEGIMPTHIAIDLAERIDDAAAVDKADPVVVAESKGNAPDESAASGVTELKAKNEGESVEEGFTLTLVDIGEIKSIVRIEPEYNDLLGVTVDVEARGDRGTTKFALLPALSRGLVETEYGLLWTFPLIAQIDKLYVENGVFKVGEEIKLPSIEESLAIVKRLDFVGIEHYTPTKGLGGKFAWVDARGVPTLEPGWFRPMMKVLGAEPAKPVIHKTVTFHQPEGPGADIYKGNCGEFFVNSDDYFRTIQDRSEACKRSYPCIVFQTDDEESFVEVPLDAAHLILEGRTTTRLNVVALQDSDNGDDPVIIEIKDGE